MVIETMPALQEIPVNRAQIDIGKNRGKPPRNVMGEKPKFFPALIEAIKKNPIIEELLRKYARAELAQVDTSSPATELAKQTAESIKDPQRVAAAEEQLNGNRREIPGDPLSPEVQEGAETLQQEQIEVHEAAGTALEGAAITQENRIARKDLEKGGIDNLYDRRGQSRIKRILANLGHTADRALDRSFNNRMFDRHITRGRFWTMVGITALSTGGTIATAAGAAALGGAVISIATVGGLALGMTVLPFAAIYGYKAFKRGLGRAQEVGATLASGHAQDISSSHFQAYRQTAGEMVRTVVGKGTNLETRARTALTFVPALVGNVIGTERGLQLTTVKSAQKRGMVTTAALLGGGEGQNVRAFGKKSRENRSYAYDPKSEKIVLGRQRLSAEDIIQQARTARTAEELTPIILFLGEVEERMRQADEAQAQADAGQAVHNKNLILIGSPEDRALLENKVQAITELLDEKIPQVGMDATTVEKITDAIQDKIRSDVEKLRRMDLQLALYAMIITAGKAAGIQQAISSLPGGEAALLAQSIATHTSLAHIANEAAALATNAGHNTLSLNFIQSDLRVFDEGTSLAQSLFQDMHPPVAYATTIGHEGALDPSPNYYTNAHAVAIHLKPEYTSYSHDQQAAQSIRDSWSDGKLTLSVSMPNGINPDNGNAWVVQFHDGPNDYMVIDLPHTTDGHLQIDPKDTQALVEVHMMQGGKIIDTHISEAQLAQYVLAHGQTAGTGSASEEGHDVLSADMNYARVTYDANGNPHVEFIAHISGRGEPQQHVEPLSPQAQKPDNPLKNPNPSLHHDKPPGHPVVKGKVTEDTPHPDQQNNSDKRGEILEDIGKGILTAAVLGILAYRQIPEARDVLDRIPPTSVPVRGMEGRLPLPGHLIQQNRRPGMIREIGQRLSANSDIEAMAIALKILPPGTKMPAGERKVNVGKIADLLAQLGATPADVAMGIREGNTMEEILSNIIGPDWKNRITNLNTAPNSNPTPTPPEIKKDAIAVGLGFSTFQDFEIFLQNKGITPTEINNIIKYANTQEALEMFDDVLYPKMEDALGPNGLIGDRIGIGTPVMTTEERLKAFIEALTSAGVRKIVIERIIRDEINPEEAIAREIIEGEMGKIPGITDEDKEKLQKAYVRPDPATGEGDILQLQRNIGLYDYFTALGLTGKIKEIIKDFCDTYQIQGLKGMIEVLDKWSTPADSPTLYNRAIPPGESKNLIKALQNEKIIKSYEDLIKTLDGLNLSLEQKRNLVIKLRSADNMGERVGILKKELSPAPINLDDEVRKVFASVDMPKETDQDKFFNEAYTEGLIQTADPQGLIDALPAGITIEELQRRFRKKYDESGPQYLKNNLLEIIDDGIYATVEDALSSARGIEGIARSFGLQTPEELFNVIESRRNELRLKGVYLYKGTLNQAINKHPISAAANVDNLLYQNLSEVLAGVNRKGIATNNVLAALGMTIDELQRAWDVGEHYKTALVMQLEGMPSPTVASIVGAIDQRLFEGKDGVKGAFKTLIPESFIAPLGGLDRLAQEVGTKITDIRSIGDLITALQENVDNGSIDIANITEALRDGVRKKSFIDLTDNLVAWIE